jgi:hypothetical protein
MPYPGLSLRVSYGGGKSWVFFYRHGGRHRRMTLGRYPAMELAEARSEWRRAAAKGRDPLAERQAQNAAPAVKLDLFERIADDCERRGFPSRQKRRELALRTKRGVPPPTRPAEGPVGYPTDSRHQPKRC